MAHHDPLKARACAASCLRDFDAEGPEGDLKKHHQLASEFLQPGSLLRDEVVRLAEGTPFLDLSKNFIRRVAALKFVPIVERPIEGKHSLVKRGLRAGKKTARSPVLVSLSAGRLLEFQTLIADSPMLLQVIAEHVSVVRIPHDMARVLGLTNHPASNELSWPRVMEQRVASNGLLCRRCCRIFSTEHILASNTATC